MILENEQSKLRVMTKKSVIARRNSVIMAREKAQQVTRQKSVFLRAGRVTSTQHLLEITKP
jgi:hypothetical protein